MSFPSRPVAAALSISAVLALTACAPTAAAGDGVLSVVASTDVYGSIAEAVGGDAVEVTSIIDSAAQDPHSYEGTARVQLALAEADVVIENGGGYDDFVQTMLAGVEGADDAGPTVITAVDLSPAYAAALDEAEHAAEDEHADDEHADEAGHDHAANEHVWYDLDTAAAVAASTVAALSEIDPENAAVFEENGHAFAASIAELEQTASDLAAAHSGASYALTEPVPAYLLAAAGLVDAAPEEFSEAVEEGTDVPPVVLQRMLDLVGGGTLSFLAYNDQTTGAETDRVRAVAEDAGLPVVSFSETLPEGQDYSGWMADNLAGVTAALSSR